MFLCDLVTLKCLCNDFVSWSFDLCRLQKLFDGRYDRRSRLVNLDHSLLLLAPVRCRRKSCCRPSSVMRPQCLADACGCFETVICTHYCTVVEEKLAVKSPMVCRGLSSSRPIETSFHRIYSSIRRVTRRHGNILWCVHIVTAESRVNTSLQARKISPRYWRSVTSFITIASSTCAGLLVISLAHGSLSNSG